EGVVAGRLVRRRRPQQRRLLGGRHRLGGTEGWEHGETTRAAVSPASQGDCLQQDQLARFTAACIAARISFAARIAVTFAPGAPSVCPYRAHVLSLDLRSVGLSPQTTCLSGTGVDGSLLVQTNQESRCCERVLVGFPPY